MSLPIGTTALDLALLAKLSLHGFALGQPCVVDINVIGDAPDLNVTEADGLTAILQLSTDIRCKRAAVETEFVQVFTLITTPIDL